MSNYIKVIILLLLPVLFSCSPNDDQVKELLETQKAILAELKEIKESLEDGAPSRKAKNDKLPDNLKMDLSNYEFIGDKNAPVTLIEFSDFQCPFCRRHNIEVLPKLKEDYIENGKVKYVFVDLPLVTIHKNAFKASEAAHCAGDQGKFWEMHDVLFDNYRSLQQENLSKYAETAGVKDLDKFNKCLEKEEHKKTVDNSLSIAKQATARGTPTFIFAYSTKDNKDVGGEDIIRGSSVYNTYKNKIDRMLNNKKQ